MIGVPFTIESDVLESIQESESQFNERKSSFENDHDCLKVIRFGPFVESEVDYSIDKCFFVCRMRGMYFPDIKGGWDDYSLKVGKYEETIRKLEDVKALSGDSSQKTFMSNLDNQTDTPLPSIDEFAELAQLETKGTKGRLMSGHELKYLWNK